MTQPDHKMTQCPRCLWWSSIYNQDAHVCAEPPVWIIDELKEARTIKDRTFGVRLSASEIACYRWPEDTAEHRAMRAAFMDVAAAAMKQPKGVYFSIDENYQGVIQLAINYRGHGYRICGPKYDGMGRTIRTHELTISDIAEIRSYLDAAEDAYADC